MKQYAPHDGKAVSLAMLGNFKPVQVSEECDKTLDAELHDLASKITSSLSINEGFPHQEVRKYILSQRNFYKNHFFILYIYVYRSVSVYILRPLTTQASR
jgi:hypothetical protein